MDDSFSFVNQKSAFCLYSVYKYNDQPVWCDTDVIDFYKSYIIFFHFQVLDYYFSDILTHFMIENICMHLVCLLSISDS